VSSDYTLRLKLLVRTSSRKELPVWPSDDFATLCKKKSHQLSGVGSPLSDSWQKAPPLLFGTGRGSYSGNYEPGEKSFYHVFIF